MNEFRVERVIGGTLETLVAHLPFVDQSHLSIRRPCVHVQLEQEDINNDKVSALGLYRPIVTSDTRRRAIPRGPWLRCYRL
uniref:Uncharacterized protein n=1 Tax=Peronospora matthiolae TaxID=2874970 RepID=A0AAV1V5W9_9STRA